MTLVGTIKVLGGDRNPIVAAILPQEFADYYLWFAQRQTWVKFFRPKTPFHLTVISGKWDGKGFIKRAMVFDGQNISVDILLGTLRINKIRNGNAIGVYADARSKEALDIRRTVGIINPKKNFGNHVTFGTTKTKTETFWPQIVKI